MLFATFLASFLKRALRQKKMTELMDEIESKNDTDHHMFAVEVILPNRSKIGCSMKGIINM
jgi:hypothetical protein